MEEETVVGLLEVVDFKVVVGEALVAFGVVLTAFLVVVVGLGVVIGTLLFSRSVDGLSVTRMGFLTSMVLAVDVASVLTLPDLTP